MYKFVLVVLSIRNGVQILSDEIVTPLAAVLEERSLPQRDLLVPVPGAPVAVPRQVVPRVLRIYAHVHVRHRSPAASFGTHWKRDWDIIYHASSKSNPTARIRCTVFPFRI